MVSTLQKQDFLKSTLISFNWIPCVVERGVESKIPFKILYFHVVLDQKENPNLGQYEAWKYGRTGMVHFM